MGRKLKFEEDRNRKFPQGKRQFTLSCSSVHGRYGVVNFTRPRYWSFHFKSSEENYETLKKFDECLLNIKVEHGNCRHITDTELLRRVYEIGIQLVLNVNLTVEHLTHEIELVTKTKNTSTDLTDRFSACLKQISFRNSFVVDPGYHKLNEINTVRNRIMHPDETNLLNVNPTEWDNIPLAWIISGKCIAAYEPYGDFIFEVMNFWLLNIDKYYEKLKVTTTAPIKYKHDCKKPHKLQIHK